MKLLKQVLWLMLLVSQSIFAAGGHDHGDTAHAEPATGMHGGRLLEQDDLALEITIYETDVPPEMRVYAYKQGLLLPPGNVELIVTLDRLGGRQDVIDFSTEHDYLLGDMTITEPHSYAVTVEASYQGKQYHWHYESFEGRSEISERLIKQSGIETEPATPQTLKIENTLYGIIDVAEDRQFHIHAPYSGIVQSVKVKTGDRVRKGQHLLTVRNQQTLQNYRIVSPADGEVTQRLANIGDHTDMGTLLEISDLSKVWVEMSMFPQDIEQLRTGMAVTINDLHGHESATGKISYISPKMSGGHIARARTEIANPEGNWRPGMHVTAKVLVEQYLAPLAVKHSAIQSFRDMPVVFARYGNTFEVRMIETGKSDDEYIEVTGGLEPETEYVINNSFLLKADVLKDGATHDH